jgi:hypothetical protein
LRRLSRAGAKALRGFLNRAYALTTTLLFAATALAVAPPAMGESKRSEQANAQKETVSLPLLDRKLTRGPKTVDESGQAVAFGKWRGTGYGGMLAPVALDVDVDGGFDLMIHLNGAMMADKDWRSSGLNAVVASIAIREVVGSAGYAKLFSAPGYFDAILSETLKKVQKHVNSKASHIRRIGIVSWSAGMGGVSQLLANKEAAERIDTVVLLDSFHASYRNPKTGQTLVKIPGQAVMGLGTSWVDTKAIANHVHFAKRATEGDAVMVVSSSAILPPDYASCAETAQAVVSLVDAESNTLNDTAVDARGMTLKLSADKGDFHVRNWKGGGPHDHFDQLHVVGDMVRAFVRPRWNRMAEEAKRELHAAR